MLHVFRISEHIILIGKLNLSRFGMEVVYMLICVWDQIARVYTKWCEVHIQENALVLVLTQPSTCVPLLIAV